ncbi:MAG: hypothetical protein IJ299_04095 [Oscillospiraceae bacterium]|nr:hypothetical protein [Oscillospiraceae bacterium]
MKRVITAAVLVCMVSMSAYGWISEDFYLGDTVLPSPYETQVKILPNTLRVQLKTGEAQELYADILPENSSAELSWALTQGSGAAKIYPGGRSCTVLGVAEGEASICVSCEGGSVDIGVSVENAPEVRVRSFDYEGESRVKARENGGQVYRTLVRVLITLGAALCFFAFLHIINKRRRKEK